jgi:Raf kinase inhibitor-like YbhB/YbcL family protein
MKQMFIAATFLAITIAATHAQAPQGADPGAGQARGRGGRGPQAPPLIMTSTAWEDGSRLPDKYVAAAPGGAVNPELKWSQVPMGTQSFVLLFRDSEFGNNRGAKTDYTHWMLWNIPGTSTGIPEGVPAGDLPDGTRQISARSTGFLGPGAGPGPDHHYIFWLYALDTKLDVPTGTPAQTAATRQAVMDAMDGHVLGIAMLVSRYHRLQ